MGAKLSVDNAIRSCLLLLVLTVWGCSGSGGEGSAEVEVPPTYEVTYYYLPG